MEEGHDRAGKDKAEEVEEDLKEKQKKYYDPINDLVDDLNRRPTPPTPRPETKGWCKYECTLTSAGTLSDHDSDVCVYGNCTLIEGDRKCPSLNGKVITQAAPRPKDDPCGKPDKGKCDSPITWKTTLERASEPQYDEGDLPDDFSTVE